MFLRICYVSIEWPIPKWLDAYVSISANINNIPVNNWAKSDHNPTFRLKDIAKRLISDGEFSISLRQSRKKRLAHFVPIKEKKCPSPPRQCWSEPHVIRSFGSSLNIDWWGVGKDEGMGRPLRAVKECYIPSRFSIVSTVIAVLNCIKCANYYFPWLSERNSKFTIWYHSFAYNFQTECWIVIRFRQLIHRSGVNISWNCHVWVKSFKDWSLSTMVAYT